MQLDDIPPQPDPLGDRLRIPRKVWSPWYWWQRLRLWWDLRTLRASKKVVAQAIAEAKKKPVSPFDGPPDGYWQTGPPPTLKAVDVDMSEEASHA